MKLFNVSNIKLWWLRLIVLLIIGVPVFSGWPLNQLAEELATIVPFHTERIGNMFSTFTWVFYACFMWLIIFSSIGAKKFLEYLAIAFIIGLTTALLGSVMRQAFPFLSGSLTEDEISLKMFNLLLIIITVVPYFLLLINSFSAKNLIFKLSKAKGNRREFGLHIALLLRVFQHAGEVVFNLLEIWSEEHPDKIFPRHRRDWGTKWYSFANIFPWMWSAVFAWIYATMIHTFEPIPGMVDEVERINQLKS